jgi:16S rRNA (uracil1498-N3)-methyltransferase
VTAAQFFADLTGVDVGARVLLDGDEGRHAADVRRLRPGEAIDLTDGAGTRLCGLVREVRRGALTIDVTERIEVPAPAPRLTVVQALARGGRDEQAVEAMTEVGVDRFVGWQAERAVARWTDRTHAKWTSTSRTAAKQSHRAWCPQVGGPVATAEVAELCHAADLAVVLHQGATTLLAGIAVPRDGDIVVVVGPEGGITDAELRDLTAAGGVAVRLGDTVLRSSTAGVAATAVLLATTRWA